jgi:hypothetical protein
MTNRKPARTPTRWTPRILVAGWLVGTAAIAAALGYQSLASPSLTAAPHTDVLPREHRGAPGEAPHSTADRPYLGGPAQPSTPCGRPGARVVRFRVLVEKGLPTTPARFVQDVLSVLCDERSWIGSGKVRFRYDPNGALLIGLRTPSSSERRCMQLIGLSVNHYYSCAGRIEVVLNSDRWFHGSRWPGAVPVYRQLLVNHEVGHTLGQHHRSCARDGDPAPVMMQQSKGLTSGGKTCKPNPWPLGYERGAVRR